MAGIEVPPGPLVSGDWLQAHFGHPQVRVLDVRGDFEGWPPVKREDYDAAHIPGAVFVDWTADVVDPAQPVPFQVAGAETLAATAGGWGIEDETVVVAYDDHHGAFACRVWWALRHAGHDRARVLDGGWPGWGAAGRPVSAEVVTPGPGPGFTVAPRPELRAGADDVTAAALVVDARPQEMYAGNPDVERSGHIPGAVNVPYTDIVDTEGAFAEPGRLAELFLAAGIDPAALPERTVATCAIGHAATVALAALEILGAGGVAVHDGAFFEWATDPARPLVQGPDPQ